MNLKHLITPIFFLVVFSCSENKGTEKDVLQEESASIEQPVKETNTKTDTVKEEKKYTLDSFYAEYYSETDTFSNDDIEQIAYTQNGKFIIVTALNVMGKMLLLVDEHKNILDFVPFRNQSGDEYAEEIYVDIHPNDEVTFLMEARDYVVDDPEVMVHRNNYLAGKDKFIELPGKEINDNVNEKIEVIRYYFKTVNDCINTGDSKNNEHIDTVENKKYNWFNCKTYFTRYDIEWQNDSLKYISNHYLIGGKLFFSFVQTFDINSESRNSIDENRYYFYNCKLIRIIEGKEKEIIPEADMEIQERAIIQQKDSIEKLYKKINYLH